jgi:hypothetical protein
MKTRSFNSYACLTIWPALMLEALAASSQSARGLFISRFLNIGPLYAGMLPIA